MRVARCGWLPPERIWTGMWRSSGSCFRKSSSAHPSMSGSRRSSEMDCGFDFSGIARTGLAGEGDQPLEAVLAHQVEHQSGKRDVVLDDEEHLVARLDVRAGVLAVVGRGGA